MEIDKKGDGKCLYLRFPCIIEEEYQVKEFNPLIKEVKFPRRKRDRFCFVLFENKEACAKALKELRQVEIKGRKLFVSKARPKIKVPRNSSCYTLSTKAIEADLKEEDLKDIFEGVNNVVIKRNKKKGTCRLKFEFLNEESALKAYLKKPAATIQGNQIVFKHNKDLQNKRNDILTDKMAALVDSNADFISFK